MQAKDIMTPVVHSVRTDTSVGDIADLLMEKRISAVPVLDDNDALVGIVSEGDLIRRLSGGADDHRPWWLTVMSSRAEDASDFIKAHGRTAQEVMTRNVVTVSEEDELNEVARALESHRIKRAPVVRDGKLVGIVSRSNLLQAVAGQKAEIKKSATLDDREIRTLVHQALEANGFVSHGTLNVIVDKGVVELWGWVESQAERDALLLAASEVDGVKEVKDHFGRVAPWVWGA